MREVAANPDLFPISCECGTIGTRLLIIELKMLMDLIANRLNPFPSRACLTKGTAGEMHKLAINLTISAWQKELQDGRRELRDIQLCRLRRVYIELTAVTDDCLAAKAERTGRGIDPPAMVAESVVIFFDMKIWIGRKPLGFNEVGHTRRVDVKQMDHRGRKWEFQRDVITNLNKHCVSSSKCLLSHTGLLMAPDSEIWRKRGGCKLE